jgi:hypothetical protein
VTMFPKRRTRGVWSAVSGAPLQRAEAKAECPHKLMR